jgi:outer membrane receptor for ferrienterochelin and colicins
MGIICRYRLYAGAENLLDLTQHDPIISADNPFSETFDAASVWGPVSGRKFYAGIRWNII